MLVKILQIDFNFATIQYGRLGQSWKPKVKPSIVCRRNPAICMPCIVILFHLDIQKYVGVTVRCKDHLVNPLPWLLSCDLDFFSVSSSIR